MAKAVICGIYALTDPETGDVRYVGQARNIHKRYRQHCNLNGCAKLPKNRWAAKLARQGAEPGLKVLEETADLDAREIHWIQLLRSQGAKLMNVAEGGKSMRHASEAKAQMPWGRKRAPLQALTANLANIVKSLEGMPSHSDLKQKLDQVRASNASIRSRGQYAWVVANLALLHKRARWMNEYAPHMDWDRAEEIINGAA